MPPARAAGAEAGLPACPAADGALAPMIASLAPLATRNRTTVLAATFTFWRVWVWQRKSSKKPDEGVSASLVIDNRRIQFDYRVIIGYAHAPVGG